MEPEEKKRKVDEAFDELRWTHDSGVVPAAPNTATAPPVDGTFEYGYLGEERDYFCLGPHVGGCGKRDCPRQRGCKPERPFHKLEHLEDHVHYERYPCPGAKDGGCGDASCPHRSGVRPYDPFEHREDLEAHVRAARGERRSD